MSQFTFIELHFEEGAIPQPDVFGSGDKAEPETDSGASESASGGTGLARVLLVVLVIAMAIAFARKLRRENDVAIEAL